ncbi:hypothetical protein AMATHDRAFT_198520 [Amanita thiersii Skay4041]|uniref:Heme haloperoxidase family profile domain-containing protein n=1 Tax=Amanita thiersii Skay4041 TaxID=703135 RepID=A0A2A9NHD1_9AGAR|nr:hypothetical protein AMATHDRAFT_198520 [Amanita thiersii Skay4041]
MSRIRSASASISASIAATTASSTTAASFSQAPISRSSITSLSSSSTTTSSITPHSHAGGRCPVTQKHGWCPKQPGDSRSPCPALNAMANHGYIARDGHNIGITDLIRGLQECYGLSRPLAVFLSVGAFFLLRRIRPISLYHIGKHAAIEHNASLVHVDCPVDEKYAPTVVRSDLLDAMITDAKSPGEEVEGLEGTGDKQILVDEQDVAKARVRREAESAAIDKVHAEIARGEMAIALGMWETQRKDNKGVRADWLRDWMMNERLPDDWTPTHVQQLRDVVKRSKLIQKSMKSIRNQESAQAVIPRKEVDAQPRL